jgi:5-deoxy-glucuronate isomerase
LIRRASSYDIRQSDITRFFYCLKEAILIVRNNIKTTGYTVITEEDGVHSSMLLDFGILKLKKGDTWKSNENKERAWLLIKGNVRFDWKGESVSALRNSCFEENPSVLHVPRNVDVTITALADAELALEMKNNPVDFTPRYYAPEDIRCDIFGGGTLNETSIRTVRTVFDGVIAPESNMVLGEVINHPGKWSSYPPHHHPQPEIYHYRHFPEQGFGVSLLNEDAHVVKNGETCLIEGGKTHSQVAGAGYAMYYIWMIPHLPGDRWLPTTRYYKEDHQWLLEKDVKIWPELKHGESKA